MADFLHSGKLSKRIISNSVVNNVEEIELAEVSFDDEDKSEERRILKQDFIVRLAKCLLRFGNTLYQAERKLRKVCLSLKIKAEFAGLPDLFLISFGSPHLTTVHTNNQTFLLFQRQGYDFGKLTEVTKLCHNLCKKVENSYDHEVKLTFPEAIKTLDDIELSKGSFDNKIFQTLSFGLGSAAVAQLAFSGSIIDICIAFFCGTFVGLFSLFVSVFLTEYSYLFELIASFFVTFFVTLFQTLFPTMCINFSCIFLSSLIVQLPGLPFTLAIMELCNRSTVTGTVKLAHSMIITLLLAVGVTMAKSIPFLLHDTSETCTLNFWSPGVPFYFLSLPLSSFTINYLLKVAYVDWIPMLVVNSSGFFSFYICINHYQMKVEPSSAITAFTIGLLGNLYGRFSKDRLAITFLSGVKGSLAILNDGDYAKGAIFTSQMLLNSIWIT
ncbi:hypothetical protein HK099_004526, partial [Clydaea vesicula]